MVTTNSVTDFWLAVPLVQLCFHRPWKRHLVTIGFKMKPCIHLRTDESSWFYASVVQMKTYLFGTSATCTCSNMSIYNTACWNNFMMAQKLWVVWKKVKLPLSIPWRHMAPLILNVGARLRWVLAAHIGHFTPGKETPYPRNTRQSGSLSLSGRFGEITFTCGN